MPLMKKSILIPCLIAIILLLTSCGRSGDASGADSAAVFTNPILKNLAADVPWCSFVDGVYYFIEPQGKDVVLRASTDVTALDAADRMVIWTIPQSLGESASSAVICRLDNAWYVYVGVTKDINHRSIYVIENKEANPFKGSFRLKSRLDTGDTDCIAIHPNIMEIHGSRYILWSGWDEPRKFEERQNLYIARLSDPWTVDGFRVKISEPEFEWERQCVGRDGSNVAYPIYVNESPCAIESPDHSRLLLFYSASFNITPYRCIGMLSMDASSDPMNSSSWEKCPEPVFRMSEQNSIYSVGGPCFVPSPDGDELYICYQAVNSVKNAGRGNRDFRIQKVTWNSDGTLDLGTPVADGVAQNKPSGTL